MSLIQYRYWVKAPLRGPKTFSIVSGVSVYVPALPEVISKTIAKAAPEDACFA
jgi:hypothetical protein